MTVREMRELFAYNAWANRQLFAAAAALPEEAYFRDLKSSHGGIHGTLAHIVWAEHLWLNRWVGKPNPAVPQGKDLRTIADVRARWDDIEMERSAFLARLTEAQLDETRVVKPSAGGEYVHTFHEMLRHTVDHSSYHRGQIVTMLRQVGAVPPTTGLILFYRGLRAALLALGLLAVAPMAGRAQAPAPLRLSFADAVRRAAADAPSAVVAGLRADAAVARVRQARAALLPSLTLGGSWANRSFNAKAQGIAFPGVPTLIGPFNAYDARARVTQTLLDLSSLARVRAARSQAAGADAERDAAVEGASQAAALAYLRAARAQAVLDARRADSALAAALVELAQAQRAAGVSASIDVTRARTQLAASAGALVVAQNQRDRAAIDLARALGLEPGTPIALADTLRSDLGAADVPAGRDARVAGALAARPDLAAEEARGTAARRTASAISAERLPKLDVAADYGWSGIRVPDAVGTRQIGVQVTLPLLDGLRREGRLGEQHAAVRESEVRARDLRQQVAAEVDAAQLDLASAAAQQGIAAERLALARQELGQARERFQAGVAGNFEVIDAQLSLVRARDADIDARFAAAAARVALARAVGAARTLR